MIDWYLVFTSSLWIFGLSIVLAAFSYHHWLAGETHRRLREQLKQASWLAPLCAGMTLVGLGFGLSERARWWERIIWFVLAAWFAWDGIGAFKRLRTRRQPSGDGEGANG